MILQYGVCDSSVNLSLVTARQHTLKSDYYVFLGLEDSFTITTDEDEPVTFNFLKFNKGSVKLAPKVVIVEQPKYGAFTSSSDGNLNIQNEMCDAQATYIPNEEFSGEDVFAYSYLYENLTTTSDGKLQARIIVRPKPDSIVAQSDEVTMTTNDGHVHIPVLKNDHSKDGSAVCITKEEKHFSEGNKVLVTNYKRLFDLVISQSPSLASILILLIIITGAPPSFCASSSLLSLSSS